MITASDLDGKQLASLYPEHITSQRTQAAFKSMGANYNVRFEAQFFIPLLSYVEKGLCSAIVSGLCAESYLLERRDSGNITFLPFRPSVHLGFAVVTPAHRPVSALATAFKGLLMGELARLGAEPLKKTGQTITSLEEHAFPAVG